MIAGVFCFSFFSPPYLFTSFFWARRCLIGVGIENGSRGRGGQGVVFLLGVGVEEGYIGTFPSPNWDGGEGWEEAVDMASSVTYVCSVTYMREQRIVFVKRTLAYLALRIIWGRRVWSSGREGGKRGYRRSGWLRAGLISFN